MFAHRLPIGTVVRLLVASPLFLQAAEAVAQTPLTIRLVCDGGGDRRVVRPTFGSAYSSNGTSVVVQGYTAGERSFASQMDIDIRDGSARVRVPRALLPAWHGGKDGWFDVKNLTITDDAITGKVLINFKRHADLRIDRHTGVVELSGNLGSYEGQSRPYDNSQKAF